MFDGCLTFLTTEKKMKEKKMEKGEKGKKNEKEMEMGEKEKRNEEKMMMKRKEKEKEDVSWWFLGHLS